MPQRFEKNDLSFYKCNVSGDVRKLLPLVIGFLLIKCAAEFYQARPKLRGFEL